MKFRNVISGPIFCADAPDVVIETADAAGIDVRLSISGFVWQFALSPVAEQSGYVATIKTRDILEALIEPSSIGSVGVSGVPVVEISAGADTESSISMSFQALYGSAAGKTPADMARHWLTWRDQISTTYFGCRERLTFFAGLDLLGWKSGSYTVAVKIYTPSGIVQATLASGTIPSQVSYISVDASPASVLAVGEVSSLLAYDLSFSLSGTAADDTAATVESYPLRLVLGTADPRAKEFIYINSLGVEDRVTACGIRKDGLEGGSSKFVNGGVEREHGNEAQEQFEVYSGHLATARSVEQWMEFLKSSERHLYNAGLKGIVIDEYDTEAPEGELSSVSFTYRLSERIRGFHHDDSESIGDYDPKQKYGALIVGDIPDATTPAAEDLFFLKTRLDEFPLVSLSEDYLLLVQSPVSYHWGAASLGSVKNWIQKTIGHNGISLAAVWASLSKTVPDTYANELISEDHIPTLPQSKIDGLAESLSALKALIGGKADSSQLADYVLKSTYDTGMSGKLDKSVFDKLFTVHYKEGSATEIESLELNYGTWTTGFLSVRGLDDTTGSGSGGTDLPAVWESLMKNEMPYQDVTINTAHIPVLPQSKVTGLPDALSSLRADYTGISALIPQAATADNQLADKEFVNSSIATATATFRGTFATLAALEATPADRNDYAFWAHKDEAGNTCYDKYTFSGLAWKFEYRLNNSSFTAAQWGAINSGITGALVTKLSGIAEGAQVNVIETVKLGGTALAVSDKAVDITGGGIKSALGISDWALAASKPSYTTAEVTEKTNLYFTDARAKSALSGHTGDTTIHITAAERKAWNAKWDWNEASIKAVKVNAAGEADKLAKGRKLWGNAFNGEADVNGDITLGSGKRIYFGSTSYYIELVNGRLHTNVGLYSDKFISARGSDPDAGGGSGASLPVVWASLQGNTDDYKDKTIHQAHIPTLPVSRIDGLATALAGKQAVISDLDTIRTNAATAFGWGDHSKAGYITLTNNTGQIYTNTVIDASALDANTWYPVLLQLSPFGPLFHIEVTNTLNTNVPSWATHQNGFTCKKVWEIYGSGWGAVPPSIIRRIIYESLYAYCDVDPVRGIGQLSNSSNDVVFVRGGGKYIFACSRGVVPTLITTSTTISNQTIAPTTTAPDEIVRNNQLTTDSIAWDRLTGKPTTLLGYGITDALSLNGGTLNGWLIINASTLPISELTANATMPDTTWNRAQNVNLLLRSENNAMTISIGGQVNERKGIIQVGHYATTYANVLGDLYLNKFGGKVYIGEKLAYHEGNFIDGTDYISPKTTLEGYGITDWVLKYSADSPDTFKTSGIYRVSTTGTTGNGYWFNYGNVLVLRGTNTSDTIAQLAASFANSNLYYRSGTISNFTDADHPWRLIYNSGNSNKIDINWNCNIMGSMGISSPYSDVFDANNPDRWVNSNYGSSDKNYSNMPDGWEYGTVLTIGQQSRRGINGDLNAQFVWDVQHGKDANNPGRLWWRTKNSINGWKNWQEIYHSGNCNNSTTDWVCNGLRAAAEVNTQRIEFASVSSSAGHGGFIDFHYNGSTADYTSRIIESASGELRLIASTVRVGTDSAATLSMRRPSYNYIWAQLAGGTLALGTIDGGATSSSNSAIFIKGKKVYIGGTETGNNALNVLGVAHATTGIYTDGYISARKQDTSSDIRLKTDFRPLDGALEYIRGTHFTRFRWKDGSGESVGIIAQEEQSREYGFLVRSHGEIGHLTYDYAASTALLGAALQEEDEKVEALKKRVKELEHELDRLKQSNYANR